MMDLVSVFTPIFENVEKLCELRGRIHQGFGFSLYYPGTIIESVEKLCELRGRIHQGFGFSLYYHN